MRKLFLGFQILVIYFVLTQSRQSHIQKHNKTERLFLTKQGLLSFCGSIFALVHKLMTCYCIIYLSYVSHCLPHCYRYPWRCCHWHHWCMSHRQTPWERKSIVSGIKWQKHNSTSLHFKHIMCLHLETHQLLILLSSSVQFKSVLCNSSTADMQDNIVRVTSSDTVGWFCTVTTSAAFTEA